MGLDEMKTKWMQDTINLVQRLLPLDRWNFKESAQFFGNGVHPTLIFDSEFCRIRIVFSASDRHLDHGMLIDYGKLGISDHASILIRGAQESDYALLWQSVNYALFFLDGLSPQEAKTAKSPRFVSEFRQSEIAKTLGYQPEKDLVLHAKIWETYGQSLFSIFDSRNDGLWERYSAFIREYWKVIPQL